MIDVRPEEEDAIYCTRGDSTYTLGNPIVFSPIDKDGNPFDLTPGQKVFFKVFNPKDFNEVFIQKEIDISEVCSSVDIHLSSEDTTFGPIINKEVTYFYEISIDGTGTIIGYDPERKPRFILLPEGGEKH